MLPAAFAAHSGSLLMLIGSPVTVVVADYAESTGAGRLGLFSTALIGLALTAATVGVVLLLGSRLVPRRSSGTMLRDLGEHGPLLAGHYGIEGSGTDLMQRGRGIAEFIVPPRSRFVGDRVHRGMVTESGDLVVVAMQHKGQTVTGPWRLKAGDSLLLQGSWEALNNAAADPDIVAVDDPDAVRRQAVPLGTGAKRALSVLAVMIVLLATGLVPAAVAGLLAALAVVLLRVIRVEQAYAGISWTTIILVGGMMSLSEAMVRSGAAQLLAEGLVSLVGGGGTVCAAGRSLRDHCGAGSADQQYGDRSDRDSDRCVGNRPDADLGDAGAGRDRGVRGSRAADPGGHAGQSDGAGGCRLPVGDY